MTEPRTNLPLESAPGTTVPAQKVPNPKGGNPFKSGYRPTGIRKEKGSSYLHKKTLLKIMLDTDITVHHLPEKLADFIRSEIPGFLETVERKFTIRQIMELVQLQLLFSRSDYVRQDAINAIKDRIDGKPMQMIKVGELEADPTEFVLPGGRKVVI